MEKAIKAQCLVNHHFHDAIWKLIYRRWSQLSSRIEGACSILVSQSGTFTRLHGRGASSSGSIGDIPNQASLTSFVLVIMRCVWLMLIESMV